MATHDYVIANGTGAAVRSDLNGALAAIVSQNSSSSAPATTYAYMTWADTTAGVMKMRNGANSAWITLYQLDGEWSTIAFENGSAAAPSIYFKDSGTDTGIYSPGTDQVAISTGGTGRLFIDSSGRLLAGTSTARSNFFGTTLSSVAQIEGTGSAGGRGALSVINNDVSNNPPYVLLGRSGAATLGSNAAVVSGSRLGTLTFHGADGTSFIEAATVAGEVDGTPGSNDMPGRLVFSTTADGAASPTERLRIDSSGRLGIGTSSPQQELHINDATGVSRIRLTGGAAGADNFEIGQAIPGVSNSGFSIYDVDATASRFVIDSTGNVGIGSTAPNEAVTIATSTSASYIQICDSSTGSTSGDGLFVGSFNGAAEIKTKENAALAFGTNNSERGRFDSSGRFLVGTSSVRASFQRPSLNCEGIADVGVTICRNGANASAPVLEFGKTRSGSLGGVDAVSSGDQLGMIRFFGADGSSLGSEGARITVEVDGTPGANDMPGRLVFSTTADGAASPTERMRISSTGDVFFGKTVTTRTVTGSFHETAGVINATTEGTRCLDLNRQNNDGDLVLFFQAGTQEGSISVSGTTVSYNGAHLSRWSQLPTGAEREEILRGTVLSNIDEMCEWDEEDNEQLNRMKVSDVEGDKNVSGVFQAWDDDDDTYTDDFYCAMTGDFIIRIAEGVTVERGDLLMSAGNGTAKPQDDDIIRSKTIAKVTSTNVSCTYEDGSYCVPCVLMAC